MASVAVAFGCWGFWRHGGPQITAAGVMCLCCALMVGYAGWYWAYQDGANLPGYIFTATAWAYLSTVAMYLIFWFRYQDRLLVVTSDVSNQSGRADTAWCWKLGLVLVVSCAGLSSAGVNANGFISAGAWIGVIFITVGFVCSESASRLSVPHLAVVAGAFAIYYKYEFGGGFGRLVVASLGLGIAMAACRSFKGRTVKVAVLALIIPAALFAGQIRTNFIQQRYGSAATASNGLGSLTSPLQTFGRLIQLHESGDLPLGHGSTFVSTAVLLVPRSVWPSKPLGFGSVLTEIIDPGSASAHVSFAALLPGEWYYDWGIIGVVVMIIAVGLMVRWLDNLLAKSTAAPIDRRGLIGRIAAITAIAGLTDFYWVGSFTYENRAGFRLLLIVGILILFTGIRRRFSTNDHSLPGKLTEFN